MVRIGIIIVLLLSLVFTCFAADPVKDLKESGKEIGQEFKKIGRQTEQAFKDKGRETLITASVYSNSRKRPPAFTLRRFRLKNENC